MAVSERKQQFLRDVFPEELNEIRRRRSNAGDDRPLWDGARPSTKHDLVGLAFSGGGIRSAAFSMGVVQHLISKGLFRRVDYLSTVSGGGFTGSCLSALMRGAVGGERLLVERADEAEPPALHHVRNRSNYLLPQGDQVRMPALFIAGFFHTLLMMLPLIVLLVFATELVFEVGHTLIGHVYWLPIVGVVPFFWAMATRPLKAGPRTWMDRDRSEQRLGKWLLFAVVSVLAVPVLLGLDMMVNYDANGVIREIGHFLALPGVRSWLVFAGAVTGLLLIVGAVWSPMGLLLSLAGALGPLLLLSIYMLACVQAINSPTSTDEGGRLHKAIYKAIQTPRNTPGASPAEDRKRAVEAAEDKQAVEALLKNLLGDKQLSMDDYEIEWDRPSEYDIRWTRPPRDHALVLTRKAKAPMWMTWLTTHGSSELHIRSSTGWWFTSDKDPTIFIDELSLLRGHAEWWLYLSGVLLGLFNYLFVDVNRVSVHPFYRDRLSRAFLVTPDGPPSPEGPAEKATLAPADELRLSELGGERSAAPYHLINTALNLQGSSDPTLRERRTVPFVLAQCFCGGDYTGYSRTDLLERADPYFNLATAMAISAAAASPNMGTVTVRPLTFLLALLNIRLNYWLPHPAWTERRSYVRPGLAFLLREAFGSVDESRPFINCSDGGHIENLAVYELLRRRCRTIVCVDGEADPQFTFSGFTTLQRYAEIDFGARITIDLDAIRPDAKGMSRANHSVGTITYNDGEEEGIFTYLKLSVTGDEPEYLRLYKRESPAFPHESTANQFFGETQFEAYRALGYHVAKRLTSGWDLAGTAATAPIA